MDPDRLDSKEASRSGSTLLSKEILKKIILRVAELILHPMSNNFDRNQESNDLKNQLYDINSFLLLKTPP